MMNKQTLLLLIAGLGLLGGVATATVTDYDFSDDFAGYAYLDDIVTSLDTGNIDGVSVHSSVYTNGQLYLYIYEVYNGSNTTLSAFSIAPFAGLTDNSIVGYLSGQPALFATAPIYTDKTDLATNPTVIFGFSQATQGPGLVSGMRSTQLIVLSDLEPGRSTGHVIDGGAASGEVIAPIPEPATLMLLGLGGAAILRRRK